METSIRQLDTHDSCVAILQSHAEHKPCTAEKEREASISCVENNRSFHDRERKFIRKYENGKEVLCYEAQKRWIFFMKSTSKSRRDQRRSEQHPERQLGEMKKIETVLARPGPEDAVRE
jgi:hypothetical protein